jgi:hypothetical protein
VQQAEATTSWLSSRPACCMVTDFARVPRPESRLRSSFLSLPPTANCRGAPARNGRRWVQSCGLTPTGYAPEVGLHSGAQPLAARVSESRLPAQARNVVCRNLERAPRKANPRSRSIRWADVPRCAGQRWGPFAAASRSPEGWRWCHTTDGVNACRIHPVLRCGT